MDDQNTASGQSTNDGQENKSEDKQAKRAGQTCITLFVVFVVSLLAFTRPPAESVTGDNGYMLQFDLLSSLGVAGGIGAAFFLLFQFRAIMRTQPTRKVLGLVGAVGLLVHTAVAILRLVLSG